MVRNGFRKNPQYGVRIFVRSNGSYFYLMGWLQDRFDGRDAAGALQPGSLHAACAPRQMPKGLVLVCLTVCHATCGFCFAFEKKSTFGWLLGDSVAWLLAWLAFLATKPT